MISADQLRQLTARADQGYLSLFLLGVLLAWLCFLAWRAPIVRRALTRWTFPLPTPHLWMILLLGLIVRVPHLFESFWYDETFTARMTSLPLSQLPTAILGDVHPPLWYSIEWITVRLIGNSEFALRLPSLIFGVLLIYLVYRMVLALKLSREVAILSALLVALLPTAAYYAAEARTYAFLSCLAVGMVIAIAEDRPGWFVLCGVLIVWSHNLGVFYLGVMGLAALLLYRRERRWWLAGIAAALGAGLWLPFLYVQSQRVAGGFWIDQLTPGGVLWYLTDGTIGRRLPDPLVAPLYLAVFVILLIAAVTLRRWLKSSQGILYLALVVGVPCAVALVSILWRPVYLTRALLPCGVGLVVLWAYLLIHSPARGALRIVSAAVLITGVISFSMPSLARTNIRAMLRACVGSEYAYATSIPAAMFMSYYVDAPLLAWTDAGDLNQSLTPEAKAAFLLVSADEPPRGDVCVLALDTPMTSDKERQEVASFTQAYPYTVQFYPIDELFTVKVYRFQIGEYHHEVAQYP